MNDSDIRNHIPRCFEPPSSCSLGVGLGVTDSDGHRPCWPQTLRLVLIARRAVRDNHSRSRGSKFLEHIVILCLEKRYLKQNSVIRLKSNIFTQKNFFAHGLLR